MIALLWTDVLVWLLVIMLALWGRLAMRDALVRARWQQVFASPLATISAIILITYLKLALLDSIHLRMDDGQLRSLLDLIFYHLLDASERTYSAPFATHEFVKSVVQQDGQVLQVHLPLRHVQPGMVWWDLLLAAALASLVVWLTRRGVPDFFKNGIFARSPRGVFWGTAWGVWFVLIALWLLSHHYHVFGTDKVGNDVLYQAIKSIRTGVLIGTLTTLLMLPLAIGLGVAAGYFKGWVDDIIQYLYTTLNSIPGVLLIAAAVLVMQGMLETHPDWFGSVAERADLRLLFLTLILGLTSWTGLCRLLRAETLKLSAVEYVTAARALGAGHGRILLRHIVPNLMHLVLISIVLDFSGLVLAEAVLTYVGVGVDPTMNSWGNMINAARLEMAREPMVWWTLAAAFVFMSLVVLAANLLSDRIQQVFNPRNA
ncbi:peptide/nickel transport system permease protein [Sulfurivirga caldicuralii]|uniref:Peptide/nickel transport system permease protein n=1 Tax=Sulfurivirga caldicuralii TaxID=364032 RepID=A0A1N6FD62_9GAMM|nr:ABC transporter permease [Sulfurivirga caldicuralii]SIN93210.1 peptide/nickel transport system permease protein [Sulfurivirga caldicuralii]